MLQVTYLVIQHYNTLPWLQHVTGAVPSDTGVPEESHRRQHWQHVPGWRPLSGSSHKDQSSGAKTAFKLPGHWSVSYYDKVPKEIKLIVIFSFLSIFDSYHNHSSLRVHGIIVTIDQLKF